jgi:hypothetical protein
VHIRNRTIFCKCSFLLHDPRLSFQGSTWDLVTRVLRPAGNIVAQVLQFCRRLIGRTLGDPLGSVRRFVGWTTEGTPTGYGDLILAVLKKKMKKDEEEERHEGSSVMSIEAQVLPVRTQPVPGEVRDTTHSGVSPPRPSQCRLDLILV